MDIKAGDIWTDPESGRGIEIVEFLDNGYGLGQRFSVRYHGRKTTADSVLSEFTIKTLYPRRSYRRLEACPN